MKRFALLTLMIPVFIFPFIPTLWNESPVMIFDSPSLFEFGVRALVDQNLFTLEDASRIIGGEEIVIDRSRLEMLDLGLVLNPKAAISDRIWLGTHSFKLGIGALMDVGVNFFVPKGIMRVILGDVDFDEDIEEEFQIASGGIFSKVGGLIGFKVFGFDIAVSAGAYLPLLWFTEDSKALFYYHSDSDMATVRTGISGDVKVLSAVSSFENVDEVLSDIQNDLGYYVDLGIMKSFGKLKIFGGFNNVTIEPAYVKYFGYASVSFQATYSNLQIDTSEPQIQLPENLEELPEPTSVELPIEYVGGLSYDLGWLEIGGFIKSLPSISLMTYGGYLSLFKILWLDAASKGSTWFKDVGVNLDLKLMRITLSLGVIDYGGLLNFDLSKMTGLNAYIGISMGW